MQQDIKDSTNTLTIKDTPVVLWIVGIFFMVVGLSLAIDGIYIQAAMAGGMGFLLFIIMGFGSVLVINKNAGEITLTKYSLLGKNVRQIWLDEFAAIHVEGSRKNNYRLEIELVDGERIPLTSYYTSGHRSKERRANQITEFIGPNPARKSQTARSEPATVDLREVSGNRSGVDYRFEFLGTSAGKATRWKTQAVNLPAGFVALIQNAGGQKMGSKGILGQVTRLAFQQIMRLIQIDQGEIPDLAQAEAVQGIDTRLEEYFTILASSSTAARQALPRWAIIPLVSWSEKNPVGNFQVVKPGEFGPLFVLFSQSGLTLGFVSPIEEVAMQEQIIELGIDLARAHGA